MSLDALRSAYFSGARYHRGDGKHQPMYDYFRDAATNIRFNWLYEVYVLWHNNRAYMARAVMERRGKLAGVDPALAAHVAHTVHTSCKRYYSVTAALALGSHRLLDLCLNPHQYAATAAQIIAIVSALHDDLDAAMDTLLESIADDYDEGRCMPLRLDLGALDLDARESPGSESPGSRESQGSKSPDTAGKQESPGSTSPPHSPRNRTRMLPRSTMLASLGRRLSPR
jgi:hypothetical protein